MEEIRARYARALDAKPSKGPFTEDGIAALCDSVGDIPTLLAKIDELQGAIEHIWEWVTDPQENVAHGLYSAVRRASEL